MATIVLALFLAGCPLLRWTAASAVQNLSSVMDASGHCVCTVILPDDTFPLRRIELLETSARNLTLRVQREMEKLQEYGQRLAWYEATLQNASRRLQLLEVGDLTPTELDFQELRKEIGEMESFVSHLRSSLNGSDTTVEVVHRELQNMSVTVSALESYDKNHVVAMRRELTTLKQRLEDCQKDKPLVGRQPPIGTCNHRGIWRLGKPSVVQLNWRGASYKAGAWGKESALRAGQKERYWVALLNLDGRRLDSVRLYGSYQDLLLSRNHTDQLITGFGQGAGPVLYNGSFYYNCYNARDLCRLDLESGAVDRKAVPNAAFNNRFSYTGTSWQGLDLAADESGLWVLYATERSEGDIVIGRLGPGSLALEKTWQTSQYKPAATNAFMVCGVMYATRAVSTHREEIFYAYDTRTGRESRLSLPLDKVTDVVRSLSYNPSDHKLYMFSDGYLLRYDVLFRA
ncbi:olfactomedin-like [Terrapene carolina triunguis]|uniref:olfactomedin-like n=1 Tax=Terrapene triunguis TaxID=2587831 RepID=UPI000E77D606|nr:olfactomedin-like [Terrapene carolina triunguis]